MRRIAAVLFTFILSFLLLTPVFAASQIEITRQPQNLVFPEHGSAYWNVEATGDDLVYTWFIVYEGVAYNTAKSFVENHPWQEGIVGDGYGQNDAGNEFFIDGIGSALDGAEIYCVISNETGSVTSQEAHISVSGKKSPPQPSAQGRKSGPGTGQATQGWQNPCGPRGKGSAPGPGSTAYAP